jgi:hypothetical protein
VLGDERAFRQQAEAQVRHALDASPTATKLIALLNQIDDIPTEMRKVRTAEGERTQPVPNKARLDDWLGRFAAALEEAKPEAERSVGRLRPPDRVLLSPFSGTPANQPPQPLPAENVAGLGRSLFTDYLLAVELGGTLLLVATVGAVVISFRRAAARRAA